MNILSLVGPMQHLIAQNLKRLDIEANVVGFRLIQGDNIFPETLKKFGHDLSMSRGLRRRLELESSRSSREWMTQVIASSRNTWREEHLGLMI